jgi:uncharacterized protein (TIGR03083 family)
MDRWPIIHQERTALAADLTPLAGAQWDTPSLCADWSVRDVLAHMTASAKISPTTFFPKLLGSGFSFTKLQAKDIARERGSDPTQTLTNFEAIIGSTKRPPGPPQVMLGETLIHAEDIRGALGVSHDYPVEMAVQVADFYKGSNLIIGAKKRIEGLTLRATDTAWSHGTGPEVAGPITALVMAMTGRKKALGSLEGDGVMVLSGRD